MRPLFLAFILPLLISASPSGKGHIFGIVTDSTSGKPLVGASVIVRGTDFGAASDTSGFFSIRNLAAGKYRLMVSYIGFRTVNIDSVEVKADSTLEIDFALNPSSLLDVPIDVIVPNLKFKTLYFQPDSTIDFKITIVPFNKKPAVPDTSAQRRRN